MKTEIEPAIKEFPEVVDLGREEPDYSDPVTAGGNKKRKTRICYPCLYLPDLKGLKGLETDGYALVKYHVNEQRLRNRDGQEPTVTVDLEIRELHLPEEGDGGEDLASAMEKFATKKVSVAKDDEDDEETDE